MAHLVEDITKFFQFDDVDIDNWNFKLFSKGCVILFFAGSMVGVMSQYFGEPIQCDFKGVDGETAKDFCWIHGSSYIPPQYQAHMRCIADLDGVEDKADAPDTSYYQWVTFMQLFQAGMFLLPPKIWKSLEGGLIESFGMEGKSVVMLTEQAKYEDGVIMEVIVEKFVKYYRSILHHNQRYFFNFLLCEVMNFVLIFFNYWVTDLFLQGRFRYFGWDVIRFYTLSKVERSVLVNPFCAAFPKEISCDVPTIGASGGEQWHNGLCVLSQNVINEKMYLIIWFYVVFAMCSSTVFVFYRLCTLLFEPFRFYLLYVKVRHKYDDEVRSSLKYVLSRCYLGDWFVLLQLSKNVNLYFFREFIKELKREMKGNPKGNRFSPLKLKRNHNMNIVSLDRGPYKDEESSYSSLRPPVVSRQNSIAASYTSEPTPGLDTINEESGGSRGSSKRDVDEDGDFVEAGAGAEAGASAAAETDSMLSDRFDSNV